MQHPGVWRNTVCVYVCPLHRLPTRAPSVLHNLAPARDAESVSLLLMRIHESFAPRGVADWAFWSMWPLQGGRAITIGLHTGLRRRAKMAIPAAQLATLLDAELRSLQNKASPAARQAADRALARLGGIREPTLASLREPVLLSPFVMTLSQPRAPEAAAGVALQSIHRQLAMGVIDAGAISSVLDCLRLQVSMIRDELRGFVNCRVDELRSVLFQRG